MSRGGFQFRSFQPSVLLKTNQLFPLGFPSFFFNKPAVSPEFLMVMWKDGLLERRGKRPLDCHRWADLICKPRGAHPEEPKNNVVILVGGEHSPQPRDPFRGVRVFYLGYQALASVVSLIWQPGAEPT